MTVAILIVVAVVIAGILAYAATKPDEFLVQRSIRIDAAPESVFPLINNLHAQALWSPFEKDPNMKRTHSGAASGPGAVYEWDGNRQVGAGRIAITDSVPPSKVALALDMFRPFAAHNRVEFSLERIGLGTNVTWAMRGRQPYMAKVMGLVMNCDKMVGGMFDEGLAKLKKLVETPPAMAAE